MRQQRSQERKAFASIVRPLECSFHLKLELTRAREWQLSVVSRPPGHAAPIVRGQPGSDGNWLLCFYTHSNKGTQSTEDESEFWSNCHPFTVRQRFLECPQCSNYEITGFVCNNGASHFRFVHFLFFFAAIALLVFRCRMMRDRWCLLECRACRQMKRRLQAKTLSICSKKELSASCRFRSGSTDLCTVGNRNQPWIWVLQASQPLSSDPAVCKKKKKSLCHPDFFFNKTGVVVFTFPVSSVRPAIFPATVMSQCCAPTFDRVFDLYPSNWTHCLIQL